jgi:anti-sigma factor RsiW
MNDETLTLYYYDELNAAERREVEAALAADAALAERYRVLREELTAAKS